ncbi:MAG: hypothetical protein JNL57_06350 [Bacteroidetes bacterium]|nr:hypothetical protein [Bacteroidota bacterium]
MQRALLICIFWIEWVSLQAQTTAGVQRLADSLLEAGHYTQAAALYERLRWFAPVDSMANSWIVKESKCLISSQQSDKAIPLLRRMPFGYDTLHREMAVLLLQAYFDTRDFSTVTRMGKKLAAIDTLYKKRYLTYACMAWMELGREDSAVQTVVHLMDSGQASRVKMAYSEFTRKLKKPRKAYRLSMIPGLGQLYAHDGRNAVNAFLLNGGIITLVATQTVKSPPLGILLFLQLVPRYYAGNMRNAAKSAVYYNRKQSEKLRSVLEREIW